MTLPRQFTHEFIETADNRDNWLNGGFENGHHVRNVSSGNWRLFCRAHRG